MKLATFIPKGGSNEMRIGAVYEGSQILDLSAAYALSLQGKEADSRSHQVAAALLPPDMIGFCDGLPQSLSRAETAISYVHDLAKKKDPRLNDVLYPIKDITLKAPLPRPRGMGIGYFNQKGIIEEASRAETEKKTGKKTEGIQMEVVYPKIACISWSSPRCVIGPDEAIVFPKISKKIFDSIELEVVIGREAYKVPKEKADDYILGYTVTLRACTEVIGDRS
jgi:2-keto-4-pentenoate hydratase/2-oxohepta-3-ene-1,7-dioic acid hydratase in catechol pathway